MPSEQKPSQSINIIGSQLSGTQMGGQASRDLNLSQQIVNENASQNLTSAEVATLLDQLKSILQTSGLSESEKEKVTRNLDNAKDEAEDDKPDKGHAAKSLQKVTKVLKDAGETVDAGTGLWKKVKPIMEALSPWLGVAAGFLL